VAAAGVVVGAAAGAGVVFLAGAAGVGVVVAGAAAGAVDFWATAECAARRQSRARQRAPARAIVFVRVWVGSAAALCSVSVACDGSGTGGEVVINSTAQRERERGRSTAQAVRRHNWQWGQRGHVGVGDAGWSDSDAFTWPGSRGDSREPLGLCVRMRQDGPTSGEHGLLGCCAPSPLDRCARCKARIVLQFYLVDWIKIGLRKKNDDGPSLHCGLGHDG
jgi:hypothetical protein